MPKLHVHIGHHFFGSGNLGDDLMLAGFLEAARPAWLENVTLTCCTAHDAWSQRLRFPEIDWLPCDQRTRAACIQRCEVWLGLGDTPFQATGGNTWFLDHLCQEAAWCRQCGVPMFYLGVGVNERAAADYPQTRLLVGQAERIWLRDEDSVEMLRGLAAPGKATAHGDLAHLALAAMRFPSPDPGTSGMVLNFEDPAQFRLDPLADLARMAADAWRVLRWLAQEVRPLPGSETQLYGELPPEIRAKVPLLAADYAQAPSARALLNDWEGLDALFVSRYHAALIGAWMGARVAVFVRNDKVAGAARQLGLPTVAAMDDPAAILRAVQSAQPVERGLLVGLRDAVREACESFFALASPSRPRSQISTSSSIPTAASGDSLGEKSSPAVKSSAMPSLIPSRILFLRPDAYGDIFLFEPVLRLVRNAWPQAEIAVLIREPYQDVAPLLETAGVRWLTTACDPYRQSPGDDLAALNALRDAVRAFAPDCVVAACAEQTWLEPAVAAFLPDARQVSLGRGLTDPIRRVALDAFVPVDWAAIYPEKVPVEPESSEWEKNLRLVSALLNEEAPRWWPVARVPESAQTRAAQILAESGLAPDSFIVCAAAGTANVPIKSWPAAHYGETLAWLEREHGIRALLIGHVSERERLEAVRQNARGGGADPALWVGQDGEMHIVAGLLEVARFYFGNDTGALHLAAALGRPVAAVFGGGTWPRFQPVAHRALTVVQPLPCFGCGWDCLYVDAPCVKTISPASVRRALEEFLQDDAEGQRRFEAEGLDAGARALIETTTPRLRFVREDSADRLRQIQRLAAKLKASETDRDARRQQVEDLTALLKASETDRNARLLQIEDLTVLLKTSETDHLLQVEDLTALLKASETDRDARLVQVEDLTALLKASETDRDARLLQVEQLTPLLLESEADRNARGKLLGELAVQIQTMDANLKAQGEHIQELTAKLTPPPSSGTA